MEVFNKYYKIILVANLVVNSFLIALGIRIAAARGINCDFGLGCNTLDVPIGLGFFVILSAWGISLASLIFLMVKSYSLQVKGNDTTRKLLLIFFNPLLIILAMFVYFLVYALV